ADRFSFNAAAGQQIALDLATVTRVPPESQVTMSLFDPNGAVVTQGGARLPGGNDFLTLPLGGTYIVELAASGVSGIIDYRLLLSLVSADCAYTIAPRIQTLEASGGAGSITVAAAQSCTWTAASLVNWLTIDSGASGAGDPTIVFTAEANTAESSRRAALVIAGQTIIVEQAGKGGSCAPVPIAPGQSLNGKIDSSDCLSRHHPDDVFGPYRADLYSFNYTEGQQLSIGFNGFFPAPLYLFDTNGTLVLQGSNGTGLFSLPASGTYFIEIPGQSFSTASYNI